MKVKTINAVLSKKMNAWWDSIEDGGLRARVKANTVVTGGCIASMLLREPVSDYDVYLSDFKTTRDLAEYYLKQFKAGPHYNGAAISVVASEEANRVKIVVKSAGVAGDEVDAPEEAQSYTGEVMQDYGQIEDTYQEAEGAALENEDKDYRPVFLSTNAITLSGKVQFITRFIGTPAVIHENYDFVHCTNYWTRAEGTVVNPAALESLLTKELRYVGSKYPLCSIIRLRKFIKRNWTINAGQMLKIMFQLNQLDLTDIEVLEEQLTGVDVAYFNEVIYLLREKDGGKVEAAYLLEIIDRMF